MLEKLKDKKIAIFVSLICMLLWGSAIPTIKTTYSIMDVSSDDTGSKILIAGIRFFIAGVMILTYYRIRKKEKLCLMKVNFKYVIMLSLIQTSIQYIFYYLGLSNTSGVKASIIQSANAFFIVIISRFLINDEYITTNKVFSLILGTLGILIVNYSRESNFEFKISGEGFILIATIFNSLASVMLRKFGKNQNPFLISGTQFLLGSIPMIILGVFTQNAKLDLKISSIILILYAAFISAAAFTLWALIMKWQNSSEFGIYKLFIPIFGSLLSVIFLNERFTVRLMVGMIFVIIGSLVLNIKYIQKN